MGFNYRQKRKEFEQNWAKALKQYIAAGMTQEQITAMREFDEELFLIIIQQVTVYPAQRLGFRLKNGLELEETCGKAVE